MDVMRALWHLEEATVAEVHEQMQEHRDLAPTTVATVLRRLEKRGLVQHRVERRQYVYRAGVNEEQVRRSMVGDLAELLFEGDVASMVSHLIQRREMSPGDLTKVRELIEEKARRDPEKADPGSGSDAAEDRP
jgi:predicted transcriptional regulator